MGSSFTNYQVHSDSTDKVVRVVKDVIRTKAYLSPPKNGWVTIYDEMSDEEMDYYEIRHISQELSFNLSTVVFVFFVYKSSYLIYFLYDEGKLIDEYHSDPEGFRFGFEIVDDAILNKFQGNPQIVLKYCISGTKLQSVSNLLIHKYAQTLSHMPEDTIYELASLLGIDELLATQGFRSFEEFSLYSKYPSVEEAQDFLLVQRFS